MTDYTTLPAGTQVQTRDGRIWTVGPHPIAKHVRGDDINPVVLWKTGQEANDYPLWIRNMSSGRDNPYTDTKWDIVKILSNYVDEDPIIAYDRAMKIL